MDEDYEQQSVTQWIDEARQGDERAQSELWARYYARLLTLARHRLDSRIRRVQDEEDIVAQTFQSLFEAIQREGFKGGVNRDDLWRLLVRIAENKIIDLAKALNAQKRGNGLVRGHSVMLGPAEDGADGFGQVPDPSPEFADHFAAAFSESVARLKPELVEIVKLKMQGYTNKEISESVGIGEESVRRKLVFIRQEWESQ